MTPPKAPKEIAACNDNDASGAAKGRCPICGKPRAPEYRPFCSKRCADVDLGRWLKGDYVVPGHPDADEDGDNPAGQGEDGT